MNALTPEGIVTDTQAELIQKYTDGMKAIYGDDINLAPDTPDGQQMMITIQMIQDKGDLLKQIFTSFDPDQAIGKVQDRRNAINGIQRKDGTYSSQYLDVTVSQAVTLFGIDNGSQVNEIYTVSDNVGNKWLLVSTVNIPSAGTSNLLFRAEFPGAIITTPNTINVPVSVVIGVESINNPTVQFVTGIDEETDMQYRVRRQKAVALSSEGYVDSLEAALQNIDGITYAIVIENDTSDISSDGQPAHSVWVILEGTAEDVTIATTIFAKKSAGSSTFGDLSYDVTLRSGNKKTFRWDLVEPEALFVKMNIDSIDGETAPNVAGIVQKLPTLLLPNVNEKVNVNTVAKLVQQIDSNALATNIGLGKTPTGPFTSVITPTSKKNRFFVQSSNVIVLPMQLTPPEIAQIVPADTRLFKVAGGYGTIIWTMFQNESGGSVSTSGLYTAGATVPATDIVRATDSLGNHIDAIVGVS